LREKGEREREREKERERDGERERKRERERERETFVWVLKKRRWGRIQASMMKKKATISNHILFFFSRTR